MLSITGKDHFFNHMNTCVPSVAIGFLKRSVITAVVDGVINIHKGLINSDKKSVSE